MFQIVSVTIDYKMFLKKVLMLNPSYEYVCTNMLNLHSYLSHPFLLLLDAPKLYSMDIIFMTLSFGFYVICYDVRFLFHRSYQGEIGSKMI